MTETPNTDYGDPADWDDEWPDGLPARVADELRELGWKVTGWHDGGVEIALPPHHETGVWLGGGGRLWTGLLESDSTCRNPIEVTADPADPGEIASNADPLLKEIAKQAERMGEAIALGELKAFLDALAVDPQPCDDAYPDGIVSVPGPDGPLYLTEHALRTLYAKYERAAKGWRLERARAETLEAENAGLFEQAKAAQSQAAEVRRLERELADTRFERDQARRGWEIARQELDSVKLLAEQIRRYAQWPGITDTATYPEVVEPLRYCALGLVRALGMGVPQDGPSAAPGAPQSGPAGNAEREAPVGALRATEGGEPEYLPGYSGKLAKRPDWLDKPQPEPPTEERIATYRLDHCEPCRDPEFYGWTGNAAREAHARHMTTVRVGPLAGTSCKCPRTDLHPICPRCGCPRSEHDAAGCSRCCQMPDPCMLTGDTPAACPGCGMPETNCCCG